MSRQFHSGAGAVMGLVLLIGALVFSGKSEEASPPPGAPLPEAAPPSPTPLTTRECDRFASPRGSDQGRRRGGLRRPYRSVPRLVRSLRPGQTGCLEPGVYRHDGVAQLQRPRTVLRGTGTGVQIQSPIWIMPEATGAQLLAVSLTSRSREYPEPLKVQADRARIADNHITGSSNTICVLIGSQRKARGVVIERNRIRRCGRHGKLDHLIYVQSANETTIRWNLLTENRGGWAVHLYPDADRSLIEHNVIDGNRGGVIFGGDGDGDPSDDNVVRNNAITFSSPRWNIEGSWSDGRDGVNNLAYSNCLLSRVPDRPAGIGEPEGFVAAGNLVLTASPYVDRGAGDYAFQPNSPCLALVGDIAQATVASR